MFILNPDPYSLPCYRIGPFRTSDLASNHLLPDSDLAEDYFRERFKGKNYIYTINGRQAINLALSSYNLKKEDVVTIFTTSGNFYISGCVTREIEKFCRWSRVIQPETRLLFVNHEFGYPYPQIKKLRDLGYPIIEDCAGSFFSDDPEHGIGNTGDFVIYSFPKMFPLQVGGMLVNNKAEYVPSISIIDKELLRHIKNVLSASIHSEYKIIKDRLRNYAFLKDKFESLGCLPRFDLLNGTVPSVFMFCVGIKGIDLPELKKYYYAHGVQCSVFYGEQAFFLPVHQSLEEPDMEYFFEIIKSFFSENQAASYI